MPSPEHGTSQRILSKERPRKRGKKRASKFVTTTLLDGHSFCEGSRRQGRGGERARGGGGARSRERESWAGQEDLSRSSSAATQCKPGGGGEDGRDGAGQTRWRRKGRRNEEPAPATAKLCCLGMHTCREHVLLRPRHLQATDRRSDACQGTHTHIVTRTCAHRMWSP